MTTSQGFWRAEGYFGRAGIYEYRKDDGSTSRELRPSEEVGSPEALASFDAAPVTIGHPAEDVTAENVRRHEVGTVLGEARMDGMHVAGAVVVKDARAIKQVKAGKQELSPGYSIKLDETPGADRKYGYPGNPEGRYDAVQRHIRVNHLAIVDRARGGSTVRLRMDALEQRADEAGKLTTAINGHQHLVERCGYDGMPRMSGSTTWAVSEGAEGGHSHDWVCQPGGKITIALSEGHTHELLDDAARPVGTRVRALVDHMPGMRGQVGVVAEAHPGSPPYYAITFDDQKMFPGVHRWLTADEVSVEQAPAMARGDAEIDRAAHWHESGSMDKDEQIRSLKAQVDALEQKLAPLSGEAKTHAARADSAAAQIVTLEKENGELRAQIASAAVAVETAAILREKQRADGLEATVRRLDAERDGAIQERVALEREAAIVLPDLKMRGLTDRDIVASVVKRLDAQQDIGSAVSDAYLRGRFDSLLIQHKRNARSTQQLGEVINTVNTQRADSLDEKRAAYRNQGTEPLPNDPRAARRGA